MFKILVAIIEKNVKNISFGLHNVHRKQNRQLRQQRQLRLKRHFDQLQN